MDKRAELIEEMYDRIGYTVPMDIKGIDTVDIDRGVLAYLKFTDDEIDMILDNPKSEDTGIDMILGIVRCFDVTIAQLEADDDDDDWEDEGEETVGELIITLEGLGV